METFLGSSCVGDPVYVEPALTDVDLALHYGLECLAWDATDPRRLRLDAINVNGGCGFPYGEQQLWSGVASVDDGNVQLHVDWNFEGPNGCGRCPHNFSFALSAVAPLTVPTMVVLTTRDCTGTGCPPRAHTFVLPINSAATGVVCTGYASFDSLQQPVVGRLNTPPHDDGTCDIDLVAAEVSVDGFPQTRCVATCLSTAPCPIPDVLTCQAGLCLLSTL